MINRPYQEINGLYLPLIEIQFVNLKKPDLKLFEYSLLDTGGSVTLIPYFLIDELELLPLDEIEMIEIEVATEKRFACTPYFLTFSFDNQNFYDSIVYYTFELVLNEVIIGRNILNEFSVNFDGINKRIIIYP